MNFDWAHRIPKLGWAGIILGLIVIFLVIVGAAGGLGPRGGLPQACYDAQNAKSLADAAGNEHDRFVADAEYTVKAQECEDAGGDVP